MTFPFRNQAPDLVSRRTGGLNRLVLAHFWVISDVLRCVRKVEIIAFRIRFYFIYPFSLRPGILFRTFDV